jgi:hypothetical protein
MTQQLLAKETSMTTPGDAERKERIGINAAEALKRLANNQTYEDWRQVGAQMMIIAEETMAELEREKWDGNDKGLVREFTRRFDTWQTKVSHNVKPISKQERWALREVLTVPEYHAWYTTLPGPQQRRMNHPNAIINAYKRKHPDPAKPQRERKPSPAAILQIRDKEIGDLKARQTELNEELAAAKSARTWAEPGTVVALLSTLVQHMKAGDIYSKGGIAGLAEASPDFDTLDLIELSKVLKDLAGSWKSYQKKPKTRPGKASRS